MVAPANQQLAITIRHSYVSSASGCVRNTWKLFRHNYLLKTITSRIKPSLCIIKGTLYFLITWLMDWPRDA